MSESLRVDTFGPRLYENDRPETAPHTPLHNTHALLLAHTRYVFSCSRNVCVSFSFGSDRRADDRVLVDHDGLPQPLSTRLRGVPGLGLMARPGWRIRWLKKTTHKKHCDIANKITTFFRKP